MSTTSSFLLCYLKSPSPLWKKGWHSFLSSVESCRASICQGVKSMLFHVPGLKLFSSGMLLTLSASPFRILIGPCVKSGKLWGWVFNGFGDSVKSCLDGYVFRGGCGGWSGACGRVPVRGGSLLPLSEGGATSKNVEYLISQQAA